MKYLLPKNSAFAVMIDDEISDLISKYSWWVNHNGYLECDRKTKLYKQYGTRRLHRIVYMYFKGKNISSTIEVDHINRNLEDNRIENLREVARVDNTRNTCNHADSFVKYKGVHWDKYRKKFIARITVNSKRYYLGAYDRAWHAALAYNEAVIKYFDDKAYLNVLED